MGFTVYSKGNRFWGCTRLLSLWTFGIIHGRRRTKWPSIGHQPPSKRAILLLLLHGRKWVSKDIGTLHLQGQSTYSLLESLPYNGRFFVDQSSTVSVISLGAVWSSLSKRGVVTTIPLIQISISTIPLLSNISPPVLLSDS